MIGVGKVPNANYEQNVPVIEKDKGGSLNEVMILNELPRFL